MKSPVTLPDRGDGWRQGAGCKTKREEKKSECSDPGPIVARGELFPFACFEVEAWCCLVHIAVDLLQ